MSKDFTAIIEDLKKKKKEAKLTLDNIEAAMVLLGYREGAATPKKRPVKKAPPALESAGWWSKFYGKRAVELDMLHARLMVNHMLAQLGPTEEVAEITKLSATTIKRVSQNQTTLTNESLEKIRQGFAQFKKPKVLAQPNIFTF